MVLNLFRLYTGEKGRKRERERARERERERERNGLRHLSGSVG